MTKRLLAALAMILGLSATARAQDEVPPPPPPPTPVSTGEMPPSRTAAGAAAEFGQAGQVVIGVDVPFQSEASQFGLARSTVSSGTSTIVVVRPSADYFVTPHVTVGGLLGYARGDVAFGNPGGSSASSITELMVGARAGYNLRMTDLVSIWGRVELIYTYISGAGRTSSMMGGGSGSEVPVIVNVPVLLHPAPHFFLGAGPFFSRDLVFKVGGENRAKTTNYGLQGIIGGYFGG